MLSLLNIDPGKSTSRMVDFPVSPREKHYEKETSNDYSNRAVSFLFYPPDAMEYKSTVARRACDHPAIMGGKRISPGLQLTTSHADVFLSFFYL
jgi:hypothetical protein